MIQRLIDAARFSDFGSRVDILAHAVYRLTILVRMNPPYPADDIE